MERVMIPVNFLESGLTQLIYISRSLIPPKAQPEAVRQIVITSIQNNRLVDVTGLLVSAPSSFMQILEGPAQSVRQTYERVSFDKRHTDVEVKLLRTADRRLFRDWNMTANRLSEEDSVNLRQLTQDAALDLLNRYRPAA
jgi:hypothetical protein